MEVAVYSSNALVKPLIESVAKMMGVDRMFENTDKRVFYANKAGEGRRWATAHCVQGHGPADRRILSRGDHSHAHRSEELAKKIAATIGPAK